LEREQKVIKLLTERFDNGRRKGIYQAAGLKKVTKNFRTHEGKRAGLTGISFFNPRQLLVHGLLMELIDQHASLKKRKVVGMLGLNKCCNWNSKLCRWIPDGSKKKGSDTFIIKR
jgi:putative DNA methylase